MLSKVVFSSKRALLVGLMLGVVVATSGGVIGLTRAQFLGKTAEETAGPIKTVQVQAIRVADNDGSRAANITAEQVGRWVDNANAVYAAADIRFQFDSGSDWSTLNNTLINRMTGVEDPDWTQARDAGNTVAARYPGKIVVFFRYGRDASPTGGGFSATDYNFVVMPGFNDTGVCGNQNIGMFPHEVGHYLGLAHTFANKDPFDTVQQAEDFLRANGNNPAVFDGDGLSDTPPDPYIRVYQCGPTPTNITLNGVPFMLPRTNVMSYYHPANAVPTEVRTLTPQQITRVQEVYKNRGLGVTSLSAEFSQVGPALAEQGKLLYIAWTGTDGRLNIMYTDNGRDFSGKVTLLEFSNVAPALAVGGRLYIAWTGTDGRLNIMSSDNGIDFTNKATLREASVAAPALITAALRGLPLPGRLYLAWTGTDGRLNVMSSDNGRDFTNKVTLGETSNVAPALVDYEGRLYLAWTGTDGRLNVMRSDNGRDFTNKVTLGETSVHAPALVVFSARLNIAWTGTDGRLNIMSSLDGLKFGDPAQGDEKVTLADTSIAAPALSRLVNLRGGGYIAWTGADKRLNMRFISR